MIENKTEVQEVEKWREKRHDITTIWRERILLDAARHDALAKQVKELRICNNTLAERIDKLESRHEGITAGEEDDSYNHVTLPVVGRVKITAGGDTGDSPPTASPAEHEANPAEPQMTKKRIAELDLEIIEMIALKDRYQKLAEERTAELERIHLAVNSLRICGWIHLEGNAYLHYLKGTGGLWQIINPAGAEGGDVNACENRTT